MQTWIDCLSLTRWRSGKESTCQWRRCRRHGFSPWVGKIPRRRKQQPAAIFLPGESHGQRSLGATVHWFAQNWTRLSNSRHARFWMNYLLSQWLSFFLCKNTLIVRIPWVKPWAHTTVHNNSSLIITSTLTTSWESSYLHFLDKVTPATIYWVQSFIEFLQQACGKVWWSPPLSPRGTRLYLQSPSWVSGGAGIQT